MTPTFRIFAAAALASMLLTSAHAQTPRRGNAETGNEPGAAAGPANEPTLPIPPETKSETKHDWTAGSRTVHYTATAGNLLLKGDPDGKGGDTKPTASIFYVAYTEDGVPAKSRPITFLYNGGPGAATIWLHMGSVGPIRVVTQSPKDSGPPPYEIVPNQYSLLDKSDLVFIDAPMSGFSRTVGKGTTKDFAGVDQDIKAFNKFITRYITVNQRWGSPKYLFGESYGTPRSAALVASLNNDGISCNGVILLSSILNYYVRSPGYDLDPKAYLPSYAAIAWYYNKVPHNGTLKEWAQKARDFSRTEYATALDKGDTLPPADFDAIAAKVAAFTGLPLEYVKEAKLRIAPTRFRKELLRNEAEILGRYDARFDAFDADSAGENPGFDPSDTGITGAYVSAFHDYLANDLKYTSTEPYYTSAPGANGEWDWHHRPSGGGGFGGGGRGQDQPDTVIDLSDAMRKNTRLKVFSANGWFDLATPFFGTEHDLAQLMLPPSLLGNVQFGYYPAGHMVYLNVDALKEMHADLEKWYSEK